MRRLIVTADDFGLSPAVNEAVERAHREGILNTASLMVGEAAAADAVARARRLPGLRVGLHVVVACGRPVLAPAKIPSIVDAAGRLPASLVGAGFLYGFSRRARRELQAEIEAQFEAYAATGLALDHVDAHCHMHLHPMVLEMILRTGERHGMRAMRLPYEPATYPAAGGWYPGRWLNGAFLAPWLLRVRRRLHRAGIATADRVFGLYDTGRMTADRTAAVLAALPEGVTEIYLHPAASGDGPWPLDPAACAAEFAALIDARVIAAMRGRGVQAWSYSEQSGRGAAVPI
ncbi:MAG: hopanoid biosynthesis-associated protein HpnK [Gammaproteobacteria bacterium]